jgi:hypothetical protein
MQLHTLIPFFDVWMFLQRRAWPATPARFRAPEVI